MALVQIEYESGKQLANFAYTQFWATLQSVAGVHFTDSIIGVITLNDHVGDTSRDISRMSFLSPVTLYILVDYLPHSWNHKHNVEILLQV